MSIQKVVVILGTNASGKSSIGLELAKEFNGEIISADSRQIYKGFDLCSGKVTKEEALIVPHHLIDICNIGDAFSVADFQEHCYHLIPEISKRGRIPFIVGGTGLYIDSVTKGYKLKNSSPDLSMREHLEEKDVEELQKMLIDLGIDYRKDDSSFFSNKRRLIRLIEKWNSGESLEDEKCEPKFETLQLGVTWPKEILHRRIEDRLSKRLEQGMIEEVQQYINKGGNIDFLLSLGLEYKYIYWYLSGKYKTLDEFYLEMSRAIKRFAKKQMTWFKRNNNIIWIDMEHDPLGQANLKIKQFLNS